MKIRKWSDFARERLGDDAHTLTCGQLLTNEGPTCRKPATMHFIWHLEGNRDAAVLSCTEHVAWMCSCSPSASHPTAGSPCNLPGALFDGERCYLDDSGEEIAPSDPLALSSVR